MTNLLSIRIQELAERHGSLRAAARVLGVDLGYLSRLANGKKEPSDRILRKLDLERFVTYRRISSTRSNSK